MGKYEKSSCAGWLLCALLWYMPEPSLPKTDYVVSLIAGQSPTVRHHFNSTLN